MIVSILSSKGGVGKTDLAINLAYHWSALNNPRRKVLLLDTDPQGSAVAWLRRRQKPAPFKVKAWVEPNLHIHLAELLDGVLVIDGPAKFNEMIQNAAFVSDFVLIPVGASREEVRVARQTVEILEQAADARRDLGIAPPAYGLVFTRVLSSSRYNRPGQRDMLVNEVFASDPESVDKARAALSVRGYRLLASRTTYLSAHQHAMSEGLAVQELSRWADPTHNINRIAREIEAAL